MINVLIAGVGGQGIVLAAKVLAQAAMEKGWHVRTAETIGMAQRGGNVLSHVRMGNAGDQAASPLVPKGRADCVIALDPGEGLRALDYVAPDGLVVSAQTGIVSSVANLTGGYDAQAALDALAEAAPHFAAVDDVALCAAAGSRKVLNTGMLAAAVRISNEQGVGLRDALTIDDLTSALTACVKPQFIDVNLAAINAK